MSIGTVPRLFRRHHALSKEDNVFRKLSAALVACSFLLPAAAQSNRASLHGTVTDPTGAVIPGATVTAQPSGNEAAMSSVTAPNGEFSFSNLAPGSYEISAGQSGFNRVYKTVKLISGQDLEVPLTLSVNLVTQNVTVSAQTTSVTEEPAAQTITSVDRKDTKDSADFTIQESLALVPGVTTITGNGPRDISISVRGSNDRQAYGIRNVQLYDDGFPVTQPDGLGRADLIDPHAYETIDAVQGPSSTLYGNYATGGAVFFYTRPGSEVHGVDFGTDVGSFGFLNNYVTIGNASEHFDYSAFVSNTRAKQYIDHFSFNTTTANILMHFAPRQEDRFTFKFIDNDLDTQLPIRLSLNQYLADPFQRDCADFVSSAAQPNCATISVYVNGFNGPKVSLSADEAGLGRRDRRTIVGARWEHDLTDRTTWRNQLVWDDKDINQPTGTTSAKGSSPSFQLFSDAVRKGPLLGHSSTTYAGGFYKYENLNSYTYNVMPGGSGTAALGALTSDYFGQINAGGFRMREEIALGERLTIIGGFAGEETSLGVKETLFSYPTNSTPTTSVIPANRNFFNMAPEAAMLFRARSNVLLHARFGTGYGTPQASQLFITPAGVYGNNTSIQPQSNKGIDVGADVQISRSLQLSATGFYERFKNELVTQSPGAGLLSYTFNAPSSAHRGLVAGFDWHPFPSLADGFRIRTAYQLDAQVYRTYTEQLSTTGATGQFVRDGNRIPGVIPNNLNARAIYDLPSSSFGNFGTYLELNYRSAFWLDNANTLSCLSATIMNFDVHYDPPAGHGLWSRTHFYFDLQNLANHTYVGSAGNITNTVTNVGGMAVENPAYGSPAALAATATGSIYAGSPRSSIGGFRINF